MKQENLKKTDRNLLAEDDISPFVQPRFVSIGWRFFAYFLFISIVPILVFGYSAIQKSEFILRNEIQNRFESIASLKTSELSFWIENNKLHFRTLLEGRHGLLRSMSAMMLEKDVGDRDEVRETLDLLLKQSEHFSELFLIDPLSGKVIVSTNPLREGKDETEDNYFKEGKKAFFFGSIHFSNEMNDNVLTMSFPVKDDDGNLIGVFAGNVDLKILYDFLSDNTGLGETGETYMVSRFYKAVPAVGLSAEAVDGQADSSEISIGIKEKTVYTQGVIRALDGLKGVDVYENYDGKEVIGYYQNFPEFGLVFLVEQCTEEAFEPLNKMTSTLMWVLLLVLAADAIIAYMIANSITRPLSQLTKNARKIRKGNYEDVSDLSTNDEFGVLSDSLNQMAHSLILSLGETQNIINTMPSALFILDVEGRVTSANRSAFELSGYSEKELIGKEFMDLIRCSDHAADECKAFTLGEIDKEGVVTDKQVHCYTNGHEYIPISLSGSVLKDKKKKPIGYIIIVQDLRKLKEYARERLQKITPMLHKISLGDFSGQLDVPSSDDEFSELLVSLDLMASNLKELITENRKKTTQVQKSKMKIEQEKAKAEAFLGSIGEGVIAIDLQGNIIMINEAAEHMFGKSIEDVIGKKFTEAYRFEDQKGNLIKENSFPISEVIANKKQVYTVTYFLKSPDSKLPLATTASPVLFDNRILGVIGTFRDITKEMEVDRAKSEFVSLASHQLRTPLAGLNWLLQEVIRKGNLDDMQTEYLQDALKSNERMVHLVSDLLNVSRLETGIINVESKDVDVYDMINVLVKEASVVAKDKGQVIEFEKPDQEIHASLDKELIGQVVTNLISNAISYSEENKTIHVELSKKADRIFITVKDEGIGISKDEQEKLFTKFFRSRNASKYSTTGSGLGLYIIRKVLDVCNGKIEVESEPGKGTTFTVALPLKGPNVRGEGDKKLIEQKLRSPDAS